MVDSYLCEFIWRQQDKGKDLFEEKRLFKNIAKYVEFFSLKVCVWGTFDIHCRDVSDFCHHYPHH